MPALYSSIFERSEKNYQTDLNLNKLTLKDAKANLLEDLRIILTRLRANKHANMEDYQILFKLTYDSPLLSTHSEPGIDSWLGIKRTASTQTGMEMVRNAAYYFFKKQFDRYAVTKDYDSAEALCEKYYNHWIFSQPRTNWFNIFSSMTESQRKICILFNELQQHKEVKKHSVELLQLSTASIERDQLDGIESLNNRYRL